MKLERVDFNAVKEEVNNFLQNDKTEILGISVGQEESLRTSIRILLEALDNSIPKEKIKDKIEELDVIENAEALEDIMNRQNYTITELIQFVLQELLEEK